MEEELSVLYMTMHDRLRILNLSMFDHYF